jgi:hypothetical protein
MPGAAAMHGGQRCVVMGPPGLRGPGGRPVKHGRIVCAALGAMRVTRHENKGRVREGAPIYRYHAPRQGARCRRGSYAFFFSVSCLKVPLSPTIWVRPFAFFTLMATNWSVAWSTTLYWMVTVASLSVAVMVLAFSSSV